ncbi:hypothetical protein VNO77_20144 [Canavalia gladiata]|uniref:Uncharacterized protein n=1 Tax=Canavalia gladiata TaxID=3824 RepID=A0AAN9LTY7_CANGL
MHGERFTIEEEVHTSRESILGKACSLRPKGIHLPKDLQHSGHHKKPPQVVISPSTHYHYCYNKRQYVGLLKALQAIIYCSLEMHGSSQLQTLAYTHYKVIIPRLQGHMLEYRQ